MPDRHNTTSKLMSFRNRSMKLPPKAVRSWFCPKPTAYFLLVLANVLAFVYFLLVVRTVLSHSKPSLSVPRFVSLLGETQRQAITIAYAVTITNCGDSTLGQPDFLVGDAAAVLQYAIHQQHYNNTRLRGRYDYKLYAIYHPDATTCVQPFRDLGFTLLQRPTPVAVKDMNSSILRERISRNGCCGEKELIKFEVLTLTQHKIVVLLDLDILLLKPLDDLFDWMLDKNNKNTPTTKLKLAKERHLMWTNQSLPDDIQLFYVNDYNMVGPERPLKPAQGGFAILQPNMTVYHEILDIIRYTDFTEKGWGGVTGKFWGSMTYQGLVPYYYVHLQQGHHAVELNWCVHDNMASPPSDVHPFSKKSFCYVSEDYCEDCRLKSPEDMYSFHFTNCFKPWWCSRHMSTDDDKEPMCRQMDHLWFEHRSRLEKSWGRSGFGSAPIWEDSEHFFGFCGCYRRKCYERIQTPYGSKLNATLTRIA